MKKKIIAFFILTLFIITSFSIITIGDEIEGKNKLINPIFWNYDRQKKPNFNPEYASISTNNLFDLPSSFDLRNVDGKNFITSIKLQSGGTCWAHAIIACMESNLLMTNIWEKAGGIGEPNLAEYHLDWWNGFNTYFNEDKPDPTGLRPHHGAQFRIAAAYFARGEGAVYSEDANDDSELDRNWYNTAPDRFDENYHIFYSNDIEIFDIGENLENIDLIKNKIMTQGPINIVFLIDYDFLDENFVHYQPSSSSLEPNHNIVLIGWDDNITVEYAPGDGAWLCKNSWGSDWGLNGYFWISYYDKYCCHPYDGDEWTANFPKVEPMSYKRIYYHDYHGWQEDFDLSNKAFNKFIALDDEILTDVSFFTCDNNAEYLIKIYDEYENNELLEELSSASGTIDFRGFHTIKLDQPVNLVKDDQFYIFLELSDGGMPYDTNSNVWGYDIESISNPDESYYYHDGSWKDLYDFDNSANFCIKGLVSKISDIDCNDNINLRRVNPGSTVIFNLSIYNIGESFSKLNWKISEWPDWGTWTFSSLEDFLYPESGTQLIQVSVVIPNEENQEFSGEIRIENNEDNDDYEIIQISIATLKNKFSDQIPKLFLWLLERLPFLKL